MILGFGIAPSLPGESYALLSDAVKNYSLQSHWVYGPATG
jgi:hypothetical protein